MRTLVFVLPYALLYWAALLWSFFPEFRLVRRARVEAKEKGSKDDGSIKVILTVGSVGSLLAYPAAFLHATMFSAAWIAPAYYIGIAVLIVGSILRRLCWRALGEFFTGDVKARADQPVIDIGPYKWVRHPSYTAAMIMYVGIGIALANWLSIVILVVASLVAYGYRVKVEERALLETIGEPYAVYMRTHKRFVPGFF